MRLSGATSIPLVTNAVMFAVAGLVWTSGVITLTGALTADRRAGRVATAVAQSPVGVAGLEPTASRSQSGRATNCAIPRRPAGLAPS